MKRSQAVIEAAQHLLSAEHCLDDAYGATAMLADKLVRLRRQANLSAVVGQSAVDAVTSTLSALSAARGELVRAHGELADVKVRIGCRTVASGGEDKDDEIGYAIGEATPLSVIAA